MILVAAVGCLVLILAVGTGLVLQQRLLSSVVRIDNAFAGLGSRPEDRAPGSVSFLVLTTDRTSTPVLQGSVSAPSWLRGARHVDSAFVLHLDAGRRSAVVVSLPDSAWRPVLAEGPADVVSSVERVTDLRIDRLGAFDWAGYEQLTNLDGGLDLPVDDGREHIRGSGVIAYLRAPAAGSPAQGVRELVVLRELMDSTLHQELRKQPWTLYRTLAVVCRNLWLDDDWSRWGMDRLVLSLRNMRSAAIVYTTAGDDPALWRAVARDDGARWLEQHPDQALPTGLQSTSARAPSRSAYS